MNYKAYENYLLYDKPVRLKIDQFRLNTFSIRQKDSNRFGFFFGLKLYYKPEKAELPNFASKEEVVNSHHFYSILNFPKFFMNLKISDFKDYIIFTEMYDDDILESRKTFYNIIQECINLEDDLKGSKEKEIVQKSISLVNIEKTKSKLTAQIEEDLFDFSNYEEDEDSEDLELLTYQKSNLKNLIFKKSTKKYKEINILF